MIGATTVLVIAKAPTAGRVKTRLCPPCTPAEAAELARAALRDTLATVAASPAAASVLVLDGEPGPWVPASVEVRPQAGGGLGPRLAAAFAGVDGPALLVGMDTPQLTVDHLVEAADRLAAHDAVLGPALDGGYWAIGFRRPVPTAFDGVPMSEADTGERQLRRLTSLGLDVGLLPLLRDVDHGADLAPVAAACAPRSRFARAVARTVAARREEAAGVPG